MKIKKILIKLVFIIIACSLVFTGLSSLLLSNNQEAIIAKVGKEKILLSEYKLNYQNELEYIQQIFNHPLAEEQIEGLNIKYAVFKRLVEKKLLLNLVNELNLKVGEQSIKEYIRNTKYFQNEKGEFDKAKFLGILKNINVTEEQYVADLKKVLPIMILMNCLFGEPTPAYVAFDDDIIQKLYKNHHQLRIADVIRVTPSAIEYVPHPENQALQDLYQQNQSSFYTPEYRTIKYILVEPKHFENQVNVSAEEIDEIIQESEEQRDIFNLVFTDLEEAKNAKKALEDNFEEVVSKFGRTTLQDIQIDNVTRSSLPENIREQVFALKENEASDILKSVFGWHIIKIKNIHKISQKDLEELKENTKLNIVQQKSFDVMNKAIDAMNEKINNGLTLEEIAHHYQLQLIDLGPMDINGNDVSGDKIHNLPALNRFTQVAFERIVNKQGYFVELDEYNYFNLWVTNVIPSHIQTFEESKPSVIRLWRNQFIDQKMYEMANDLVLKLQEGVDISKIEGIILSKNQVLNRFEIATTENPTQDYPKALVDEIFTIEKDSFTKPIRDQNDVLIGILGEVQDASNANELTIKAMKDEFASDNIDALKEQLINYLADKYKVEINNVAINSVK